MDFKAFLGRSVDRRNWVYPQSVQGRFVNARQYLGYVLIGIMVLLPFIKIGGQPAILFDIPGRKFVLFGTVFWPQDMWLMIFLLVALGLIIFLITAIWGRVWCGYACPQTVFLHHVFLRVEKWIEGDRGVRIRLDKAKWERQKVIKKVAKHVAFLVLSAIIAHILLAYFFPVEQLFFALFHPSTDYQSPMIFAALTTGAMYLNFGFLREQFCNYLCPYARFQSALLDDDSLIVAYNYNRGESRAKPKERTEGESYGACIDCNKCVLVCPQGIDIRNGLQLECVHCALCVDACTPIMEKYNQPSLIEYASLTQLRGGKPRTMRVRTGLYMVLIVAVVGFLLVALYNRPLVEATLLRPSGQSIIQAPNGEIANRFQLKLINKNGESARVQFSFTHPSLHLAVSPNPALVQPGKTAVVNAFIYGHSGLDKQPFTIEMEDLTTGEKHPVSGSWVNLQ